MYMKSISIKLEGTLRKKRMFKKRETIKQVEEGNDLAPKFDKNGFIPVAVSYTHLTLPTTPYV